MTANLTTIISPYVLQYVEGNSLVITDQSSNVNVLTVSNFVPEEQEIKERDFESLAAFFENVHLPQIALELQLSDLEKEVLKNFFEEHSYFA